ncbi:MAG TPA: hypothetical protein VKB88_18165 [Bryobacteraceae bacterium]|nr:hypothetical protein [Bryobacteraceae bacterium]
MALAVVRLAGAYQLNEDNNMATTPDQPKPSLHVSIMIEATFGSEIQRDVSLKVLKQFLGAWTQNVQAAHKNNRVTITVKEGPASDVIQ